AGTNLTRLGFQGVNAPGVLVNEIQQLVDAGGPANATFKLRFNGEETPFLDISSTPLQVETALNNLSTITTGGGHVSVTSPNANGGPYNVEFIGGSIGNRDIVNATEGLIVVNNGTNFPTVAAEFRKGGLQTALAFSVGVSPTATDLQTHLLSIPAL